MNPIGDVKIAIHETERSLSIEIETARLKIVSVTNDNYNSPLIDLYGSKEVNALVGSGATLEPEKGKNQALADALVTKKPLCRFCRFRKKYK